MKELSIEERAARYDAAIERAKDLYDFYSGNPAQAQKIIDIFPELIDEDEMIMKEILQSIKDNMIVIHKDKCIAWLEKQLKVKETMRDVEQKAKAFTKAHAGETSDEILAQMRGYEWSEENENHVKSILATIECCKTQFPNAQAVVEAYNADIEWLKSLKDRYTWKPSEEQIKALNEVLNFAANHESSHWNDYIFGTLNNLIRQLKKLKG